MLPILEKKSRKEAEVTKSSVGLFSGEMVWHFLEAGILFDIKVRRFKLMPLLLRDARVYANSSSMNRE